MNVLSKKTRLKSLLSGLLCVGILLSQTPMVFAADADGSAGDTVTPVVDEIQTPQEEPQNEKPQIEEPQTVEPQTEEPQVEEPQAAEESAALLSLELVDGAVEIATAQDLVDLAAAVNAGTDGYDTVSVTLTDNIDLSTVCWPAVEANAETGAGAVMAKDWTPIGTAAHPFTGEFDGNNKTISGLSITNAPIGNQGLFGVVSGEAYICDVTVSGSVNVVGANTDTTKNNEAGVIGSIDANATDVTVEGVTSKVTVNGGKSVGGIVGLIDTGAVATLADCVNEGTVTGTPGTSSSYGVKIGVGGVVGTVLSANAAISGCSNSGTVKNLSATSLIQGTGGIVGYCVGTVENCANTGAVTGTGNYYLGGIVGYATADSDITGSTNGSANNQEAGTVSGGYDQGGIAGYSAGGLIDNCTNYGAVTSTISTAGTGSGGIAYGSTGTISNCVNHGPVDVTVNGTNLSDVGGIVARVSGTVTGSENRGAVSATGNGTNLCGMGGVAGYIEANGRVYSSFNSGAVTVTDTDTGAYRYIGGVAGYMRSGSEVRFCGNTGDVSRGPSTAGAATYNAVGGVAGLVSGASLRNSWSTGTVTYSGTKIPTGGAPAAIVYCVEGSNSQVRDCYATGKVCLTAEGLTEGTVYANAIGYKSVGSVMENCVYYCPDYTADELTHIQAVRLYSGTTLDGTANCFAALDSSGYTWVNGESGSLTADQVLTKLNSKVWKLEENAAYPTLLSEAEFQALNYTVALTRLAGDNAAADNEKVTAGLTAGGSPVASPYTQAKKGDQLQLTISVPANAENALLVVGASDTTRLSAATVTSGSDYVTHTYTITVDETDVEVRYILVDTTKDASTWYIADPTATEFIINTPEELAFLSRLTGGTALDATGSPMAAYNFSGKTVRLGADLDLSTVCWPAVEADEASGVAAKEAQSWTPIVDFSGTFDGGIYEEVTTGEGDAAVTTTVLTGCHTISNLYVDTGDAGYAGLFGIGNVNNLILDHAIVKTTGNYAGAIAANHLLTQEINCTVKNSTVSGAGYVGGVLGEGVVVNCTVENTTVSGTGNYVGGVIGRSSDTVAPRVGVALTGNRAIDVTVSGADYVGGVAGGLSFTQDGARSAMVNYVLGDSTVSGANYVGGAFGQQSVDRMANGTVAGFVSTAKVTATGDYVGGIAGKGDVSYAIYYNWDAENGRPNVSTTSEDATHVGWMSGNDADSGMAMGGSVEGVSITKGYYLSSQYQENEDGSVGLTADTFQMDEILYLLQGNSSISWEPAEGVLFPLSYIPTADHPAAATLYKLTVQSAGSLEGCSVSIPAFAEGGEGYAYTLYGTVGGVQYTYATTGTEIPLEVTLPQGKAVTFYPASAVTVTEATEDTPASYAATLTANTLLEYSFSTPVEPDVSWYVTAGEGEEPITSYELEDEADLRGLAQLVNAGNSFEGITLKLVKDVTLVGGNWTPIGDTAAAPFSGSFDGGNHTIDGLYLYKYAGTYAGLFGYLSGSSSVSNLTVKGDVSVTGKYVGGVVAYSAGSLSDLISETSISSSASSGYAGGIVGYLTKTGTLDGSSFAGTVSAAYAGGLAGYSAGTVSGGENRGQISGATYTGGIVSYNLGTIIDCLNTVDLSGSGTGAGGVAGYSNTGSTIIRCGNEGKIDVSAQYVGGVVGNSNGASINQVYNRGEILYTGSAAKYYGGGIVGYATANTVLGNSYNTGSVTFVGTGERQYSYTGGLVGYAYNSTVVIYNCYNTVTGAVTGTYGTINVYTYTGGILGYISMPTLDNCYNLDTVTERSTVAAKVTSLSDSDLKAAASQLGAAFTADLTGDDSVNGGYPVLHWEVDPEEGVTLNYRNSDLYTLSADAGLTLQPYMQPDVVVVLSPADAKAAMEAENTAPEGFIFNGWYADRTDENTKYTEATTLQNGDSYDAAWDLLQVTVTLDYGCLDENGAPVTSSESIAWSGLMTKPADPEWEGHDFLDWYLKEEDESGNLVYAETAFDFASTPITEDTTIYAKWQNVGNDTSWYSEESDSFTITTVDQLYGFARLVNNGTSFAGKTVTLGADLDLSGLVFHVIGTDASHAFSGVFDGGDHTISNLTLSQPTADYQALFGYAVGGEIKNLTVTGSVTGRYYVAGILAYGVDTALSNLTFGEADGSSQVTGAGTASTNMNTYMQAGGVVSVLSVTKDATLSNLVNYAAVSGADAGGVLYTVDFGRAVAVVNLTLENCANYGGVTVTNRAGGIAAYLLNTSYAHKVVFDGCVNRGDITSSATTYYAGGILGYGDIGMETSSYNSPTNKIIFAFNRCVNYGGVTAAGAGGVAGYLGYDSYSFTTGSRVSFAECENYGDVTASAFAGGIVSCLHYTNYASLENCVNEGTITNTGTAATNMASGIAGRMYYVDYATLTGCVNRGEIISAGRAAGIVGYSLAVSGGAVFTGCVNLGDVTTSGGSASINAAGILNDMSYGSAILTGCYNAGSVTNTGTAGNAIGLAVGRTASYPAIVYSSFNYGAVSAAVAGAAYSVGRYVTEVSTYSLENCTYQYTLTADGKVVLLPAADADTDSTAATAAQFKDGTVLSRLNTYFTSQNPAQDAIWYQGANYPVLVLVEYTLTVGDSGHAAVTIEDLTANEDGTYTVLEDAALRFTVTPDDGYTLSAVTVNGETLTADEDGVYTLSVTGDVAIAVTVKRTSWSASSPASADIEKIVDSVADNTQEKDVEGSTYDETLDYNDDGLNDLLDILDILYRQKAQETETPPVEEPPAEEPPVETPPAEEQNNVAEENV